MASLSKPTASNTQTSSTSSVQNRECRKLSRVKAHTVYKTFNTSRRREFVRITEDVQKAVDEAGIREGMVLVSAMHITAGVW